MDHILQLKNVPRSLLHEGRVMDEMVLEFIDLWGANGELRSCIACDGDTSIVLPLLVASEDRNRCIVLFRLHVEERMWIKIKK